MIRVMHSVQENDVVFLIPPIINSNASESETESQSDNGRISYCYYIICSGLKQTIIYIGKSAGGT